MATRRTLFAAAPAVAALALTRSALAQSTAAAAKEGDFLFVQTAKAVAFDKGNGKVTLQGVSPVTLFFSDRPEHVAGNMTTAAFVPFWSEGKNSFLSDPPSADISILEGKTLRQAVVVLHDPVLEGDNLSYSVTLVGGELPAAGADASVFIDIIGMPMTPVSYAGVARRSYRRAWMYR
jgi:hypothetical protein